MTNAPLPSGPRPVQRAEQGAPAQRRETSSTTPAFQALLERLQERAQELQRSSARIDDPALLAGAVETARASLEDALSLGDRLLEAYREVAQQQGAADETAEEPDAERAS